MPTPLPDSTRLATEYRDQLIATQVKCGRIACPSTRLSHYNTGTDRLYCGRCAAGINQHNPGLCILYQRNTIT